MTILQPALLDTDILSAIMRRHPLAIAHSRSYLIAHHRFTFSIITRYEITRGLLAKNATSQLAAFDRLCDASEILPLTEAAALRAAEIYADLYRRGQLIGDADILIAASALTQGLEVITNNESHFGRISGLQIRNWLT